MAAQTDLAAQLQTLAVRQKIDQGQRHPGKASLLYSFQEAADIDAETIYRVGLEGLDQLCALDGRFQAYRRTLFGQASQALDRDASTADVNAKLDAAVAGFCTLLSSYFTLAPAFKALEFLVRKYKVHERNVEELMSAALPYHETEQFVRLVQILKLEPRSRWAFLAPMQQSGAPAPREALVLRCITDRSLLRFVCELAQRQADTRVAGRVALPFYAVLVCELLVKVQAVDEPLLTMLLPYLLAGLSSSVVPDYRAATYMIIGQLASRATFTADLVTVLVTETCRTASPALLSSVVMLLAHLANSQEHLGELPDKAFKHLAKVTGLVDQLASLGEKGGRIEGLLGMLARSAMALLSAHPHYEHLLQGILARVSMGEAGRVLADAVLQQAGAADVEEGPHRDALLRLLRALDLRCPEQLDAAVGAALAQGTPGGLSEEEQQRQHRVLALLSAAFEGTARCPLMEAGTTVLLAAEAPQEAVRQLAVQRLDALVSSAAGSEAAAAAGAALLRRLQDDSPAVVQAVLSSASLMTLPRAALIDSLAGCFEGALQQAGDRATKKAQRAEARGVARKVLKLLAGPLLAGGSPQQVSRVMVLLLAALLITPVCGRKVAATAAKAACSLGQPLLAALSQLPLPEEAGAQEEAEQGKTGKIKQKGVKKGGAAEAKEAQKAAVAAERGRQAADAAYNAQVVAALASQAAASKDAAAQLSQLLTDCASGEVGPSGSRAEPLVLLTAHAVVHGGEGAGVATVAAALLHHLRVAGAAFHPSDSLPKECFDATGLPTPALLERGQLSTPALRSTALLATLRCASWAALAPQADKDALSLLRVLCLLRWQPALSALLARCAEQQLDALQLLSELFAAPPAAESASVQLVATQSATTLLDARRAAARGGKKQPAGSSVGMALLCRALCTLRHPSRDVRQAGVQCALACAKLVPASELSERASKLLAAALSAQAELLAADGEAVQRLVEVMLGANDEPTEALAGYVLEPSDAANLGSALLAAAESQAAAAGVAGRSGGSAAAVAAHTARVLLELALDWAPAHQLLTSCCQLLASGGRIRAGAPDSQEAQQKEALLVAAASCFSAARLESVLRRHAAGGEGASAVLTIWCGLLDPAGFLPAAARLAALQQVEDRFFLLLPSDVQGSALKALLRVASKDADEAFRAAARAALAAMPLHADTLMPLLSLEAASTAPAGADADMADASFAEGDDADEDVELQQLQAAAAAAVAALGTPHTKQKRGKPSKEQSEAEEFAKAAADAVDRRRQQLVEQRQGRQQGRQAAEHGQRAGTVVSTLGSAAGSAAGEGCVSTLELLQWKENVQHRLLLVPAIQAVLEQLLSALGHDSEEGEEALEEAPAAAAAASMPAAEIVYTVQLCLAALTSMAASVQAAGAAAAGAPPTPSGKPKGKGRKHAAGQAEQEGMKAFDLGLAVRSAQQAPDGAVRNSALELVAVLAQGMPEAALGHVLEVVAVVGTSAALQEDEQSERVATQALRAILPAWVGAGNSIQAMAAAVVTALPRVSPYRRLSLLSALVSALPQVEGLCNVLALLLEQSVVQQAQQSQQGDADMAESDARLAAGAELEPAWAVDLAGDLMDQSTLLTQACAAAALLEHSLTASKQQPWHPLPLLSVAFVTQHLEQRQRGASAAAADELAAAYQGLMQQCLLHLQRLGERQAQQRGKEQRGAAAPAALLRTGTAGCYRLLQALRLHMPLAAFLSSLVALAGSSPADRVRRKALQLLANAVRDSAADVAWQQQQSGDSAAAVAEAALSVCAPAVQLLSTPAGTPAGEAGEPVVALTKQTALAAVGAVAGAFGAQHPQQLLACLPAVLAATAASQAAVRGSALATTAALSAALGSRLVPLLPKTVAAVISAVQSAAAAVTEVSTKQPALEKQAAEAGSSGSEGSGSGSEPDNPTRRQRRRPAVHDGPTETAALELAAALAAVAALVEHLGAFLAPHLPLLLSVLLHPAVLKCTTARCADVAAAIRRQLAQSVPTRLLLPPLLAHLDASTEAGADAACGLLRMLQSAVDAMDAPALASHHEAVFAALLRALDMRRRRPAALLVSSDGLNRVEGAAVACVVSLTMRLTEARFKPLFFRLLEWAHAVPAGDSDLPTNTGQLLRSVALFSLVNALTEQLRSVFVPYFGLLLDACVAHLSDGSVAVGKKGKKKKRKAAEAEAAANGGPASTDELYVENDWRLRLKVVRALHRCFLYDTGAAGAARFLDDARFQRILPPLVAHLGLQAPASVAAALEADGVADSAANLEGSLQLEDDVATADGSPDTAALMDSFGRAVVAALAQLGVTAGSDTQWKPLNHQVLMMTRSLDPRTRLLALETAAQLASRLSEEYLALLPETLPFLSELLEDAELAVEARAQRMVKQLEALSGESLASYLS